MHWRCLLENSITCNATSITINRLYTFNEHIRCHTTYDSKHDKEIVKVLAFYTHYVKKTLYVPMHDCPCIFTRLLCQLHVCITSDQAHNSWNIWFYNFMRLMLSKQNRHMQQMLSGAFTSLHVEVMVIEPNDNQDNVFVRLVFALLAA